MPRHKIYTDDEIIHRKREQKREWARRIRMQKSKEKIIKKILISLIEY